MRFVIILIIVGKVFQIITTKKIIVIELEESLENIYEKTIYN
jgi:hypothetical protein